MNIKLIGVQENNFSLFHLLSDLINGQFSFNHLFNLLAGCCFVVSLSKVNGPFLDFVVVPIVLRKSFHSIVVTVS